MHLFFHFEQIDTTKDSMHPETIQNWKQSRFYQSNAKETFICICRLNISRYKETTLPLDTYFLTQ